MQDAFHLINEIKQVLLLLSQSEKVCFYLNSLTLQTHSGFPGSFGVGPNFDSLSRQTFSFGRDVLNLFSNVAQSCSKLLFAFGNALLIRLDQTGKSGDLIFQALQLRRNCCDLILIPASFNVVRFRNDIGQ